MDAISLKIIIGDSLFGTWTYVDDNGVPVVITQSMGFSSSVQNNGIKYPVLLTVLNQDEFPGEIAFLVQTVGWSKGLAEMDIKAESGIYKKHSDKYCFVITEGVT